MPILYNVFILHKMKILSALFLLFLFTAVCMQGTKAQDTYPLKAETKSAMAPQSARKVVAREMVINMPTSLSGFANPNTPFLESGGRNEDVCFPNPFRHQIIREKPVDINWRIIVLENEYLHIEFAPELGGMIWRLYDKVHGKDVLHAPGKVKPTGDGFGGTYTAGGLELNYPYAHSINNTWPRKTEFRENKDGSATYIVSEWERNGRTEWSMEFTLRPGEARLRQEVTLYNRSKLPSGFVYWGNARVPNDADTRWIEPEAMASEHGGSNLFTWPIFRGSDFSLWINDPEVIGMYFLEPRYNFFGLTNIKTKSGMVHYADFHDVPGKKLWNWGREPKDGNRKWDAESGSGDEPHWHGYGYGEVQSGRMVNQDHLEWLMPEECVIWQEAWSPINGLTNVNEVTEDAAFQIVAEENKLIVYPFTMAPDVKLHFIAGGKEIKEMKLNLKTSHLQEIDLSSIMGANPAELEIRIEKGGERSGTISSQSRCEQKKASELREIPVFKEHSSESLATTAEFDHKLLFRQQAMDRYVQAIELDSLNYRAHLGLGKLLFANGDFQSAKKQFEKAIQSYKWAAEAYLMLAQIEHILGNTDAAEERAYEARYYGEKCRGNLKLGEVLISRGEYRKAVTVLEEALMNNARSLRTYALLALCERKLGNTKQALVQLDRSPSGALKDLLWYSEAFLSGRIDAGHLEKELFMDEWRYLEISIDYLGLGNLKEADQIADAGISLHKQGWVLDKLFNPDRMWNFTRQRESPFFYLVKGVIAQREGRMEDASRLFAEGDYFEHHINFNQPEMVPVLQAAVKAGNGYASFWLGNYYYHSMRPEEAKTAWDTAAQKHGQNPQIIRNLALYEKFQKNGRQKSRDLLRAALKLNTNDLYIRQELITDEKATGALPDEILKLYLDAPKEQRDSYLFLHGLLQAFKDAGKWEEAAEYLSDVDRRWSDDVKSWYDFCIGYADHLMDQSKPQEALKWIGKSNTTPANLSNISLPVDHFYRQHEFFIAGQACKMLGDKAKSQEFFRKVMEEPTDFTFNASVENNLAHLRFYVALAMKELDMEPAARGMLVGINEFRLKHGLLTLKLDASELKKWTLRDALAEPKDSE
jgi:tetratricopeptide (TPR) repeat protein